MGTWGPGPFDNDAAAEFLDALRSSSRVVAKILREIAGTPSGKYIDVDDGGAGWAACEMVALAFGYGDTVTPDDNILDLAEKLRPKEEYRRLALEALPRIADRDNSELASLWHEGSDGPQFDAAIEQLRSRLEAASKGPRELAKPKAGDVIALQVSASSTELVVVQVVNSGEVAVFEGTCTDERTALDCVRGRPARRVLTSVNKLLRRGRALGNVPVRKDLKGRKVYAGELGAIERYVLMAASASAVREVPYEEARDCDELRLYDADAIVAIAVGRQPVARVRSPDEREAALCARNAEKWAARRHATTPAPFGDVPLLERWLQSTTPCGDTTMWPSACRDTDVPGRIPSVAIMHLPPSSRSGAERGRATCGLLSLLAACPHRPMASSCPRHLLPRALSPAACSHVTPSLD